MKLAKQLAQIAASSLLFYSLGGCSAAINPPLKTPAPFPTAKKYAVINTGASIRSAEEGLIDPIDKNAFWVSTVDAYNELRKNGYLPENMWVLYKDAKPPFDEPELLGRIDGIKKEFDGSYDNISTKDNLAKLLDSLEDKINPEDQFTLYINQHGSALGTAHFEYDNSYFTGQDLSKILEGNKSRHILIVMGTCHAEAFADDISTNNAVIVSGARENKLGWIDKNFSWAKMFFEEMNKAGNDFNKDGVVSAYEAFVPAKKRAIQYRWVQNSFFRFKYEGTGLSIPSLMMMDLVPTYIER